MSAAADKVQDHDAVVAEEATAVVADQTLSTVATTGEITRTETEHRTESQPKDLKTETEVAAVAPLGKPESIVAGSQLPEGPGIPQGTQSPLIPGLYNAHYGIKRKYY